MHLNDAAILGIAVNHIGYADGVSSIRTTIPRGDCVALTRISMGREEPAIFGKLFWITQLFSEAIPFAQPQAALVVSVDDRHDSRESRRHTCTDVGHDA